MKEKIRENDSKRFVHEDEIRSVEEEEVDDDEHILQ